MAVKARMLSPMEFLLIILILTWIEEGVCIKVGSALDAASPITGKKVLAISPLHSFLQARGSSESKQLKQQVSVIQKFTILSDN